MKTNIGQDDIGQDEIDRILSREGEILPSSGFAVSVMDAVRREAAAPPPIPFPWKRALPGLVVGVFVMLLILVGAVVAVTRLDKMPAAQVPMPSPSLMPSLFHGGAQSAGIWTVLSLVVAFIAVKLSTRESSGML